MKKKMEEEEGGEGGGIVQQPSVESTCENLVQEAWNCTIGHP